LHIQRGERYSARTLTKKQGDLLLRLDLMRNLYLFRNYGKDALLLSVLAYNVGPYAILGTSKRPKSRLLCKIERGDLGHFPMQEWGKHLVTLG